MNLMVLIIITILLNMLLLLLLRLQVCSLGTRHFASTLNMATTGHSIALIHLQNQHHHLPLRLLVIIYIDILPFFFAGEIGCFLSLLLILFPLLFFVVDDLEFFDGRRNSIHQKTYLFICGLFEKQNNNVITLCKFILYKRN